MEGIFNFIIAVYFLKDGYDITVCLVNTNLSANPVNVARPEGRQKSSLPGCSPYALI